MPNTYYLFFFFTGFSSLALVFLQLGFTLQDSTTKLVKLFIMSFTRPFTTLRKLTFEIADCRVDYENNEGNLKFVIEPYIPVPSFTSTTSDPLLSQTFSQTPNSTPQATSPTPQKDNDGLMPQDDSCLNIGTSSSPQQDDNQGARDEELTIPHALSPDTIDLVKSDTDSEDCVLSRVSPPLSPKIEKDDKKDEVATCQEQTASVQSSLPPGVSPKLVLRQFPYKAAGRNYTITITETPRKRHSSPDSPQPKASTSTGTYTKQKKQDKKDKPQ